MRKLVLVAALAVSGCASRPSVIGNDRGGMISWAFTNEAAVFEAAQRHCASFGKSARVTNIEKKAGGEVLFDCL